MFGLAVTAQDDTQSAHDLMVKVVAASPNDASARYMLGVLDWNLAFPDIRKAGQQAGIPPESPQIPDATLRQSLRTAHEAQLQEGATMLRTGSSSIRNRPMPALT